MTFWPFPVNLANTWCSSEKQIHPICSAQLAPPKRLPPDTTRRVCARHQHTSKAAASLQREPPPHLEGGTGWHPLNQLPLYRASTAYHDTCTICGQTCQPVSLGSHPQQSWPNQNRRVHTGYSRDICGASGYSAQRGIVPMGPKRCI